MLSSLFVFSFSAHRKLRVGSFGAIRIRIRIRISDPRSLRSWCIKGTNESTLVTDSLVPLMHYDPSDLGSLILIQIVPKERTLNWHLERTLSSPRFPLYDIVCYVWRHSFLTNHPGGWEINFNQYILRQNTTGKCFLILYKITVHFLN